MRLRTLVLLLVLLAAIHVLVAALVVPSAATAIRPSHGVPWPWAAIADCESGDHDGKPPYTADWKINAYHDGGLQFLPSTWNLAKVLPEVEKFAARFRYAYEAPAWVQVAVARAWLRRTSWLQWPVCSAKVGLR